MRENQAYKQIEAMGEAAFPSLRGLTLLGFRFERFGFSWGFQNMEGFGFKAASFESHRLSRPRIQDSI